MFWKKTCNRCKKKFDKEFLYCPYCGFSESGRKETDFFEKDFSESLKELKMPFGFNFLVKNLMKEMDKQFRDMDRQIAKETQEKEKKFSQEKRLSMPQSSGISISISSGEGKPVIKVNSFGNAPEFKKLEESLKGNSTNIHTERKPKQFSQKTKPQKITEARGLELSKLPRQEASSQVRRLSGKVIYEIDVPGVKNIKDISVNELESSIEIKAFAKDKAYFKFIPVTLPLLGYKLAKEKLILELGEE